jgi:hypothetical protein
MALLALICAEVSRVILLGAFVVLPPGKGLLPLIKNPNTPLEVTGIRLQIIVTNF